MMKMSGTTARLVSYGMQFEELARQPHTKNDNPNGSGFFFY